MNHLKLSIIFILLLPLALYAQRTISGRVTAADGGAPILGASVFIDGTTAGISADAEGYYSLTIPGPGSYSLVVSHAAFQRFTTEIEPGQTSLKLDVALQIRELDEVMVTARVRFRKTDIDLFWSKILGKRPHKSTIYATNPEAVFYNYDSKTDYLKVYCHEPLHIINVETGYHIEYTLDRFEHDYKTDLTSWDARFMFRELEPKNRNEQKTWEKNRDMIYSVSIVNFIRSLYSNSLVENGFVFVRIGEPQILNPFEASQLILGKRMQPAHYSTRGLSVIDYRKFLSIDTVSGLKMLYVPPDSSVMLYCYGQPLSDKVVFRFSAQFSILDYDGFSSIGLFRNLLFTPNGTVQIFPDGTFRNTLLLSPRYSSNPLTGLNMALPIEYNLDTNINGLVQAEDDFAGNKAVAEDLPKIARQINTPDDSSEKIYRSFEEQLSIFPQEKVYLHTDKPYYLAGERIWFRAHVVDAATHLPEFSSHCVYVELFNAKDSAICRVKTGSENDSPNSQFSTLNSQFSTLNSQFSTLNSQFFSGYLLIPENAPEGDYTIRAYTNLMRELDEDYFFMKTVRIANPTTRLIRAFPEFSFSADNRTVNTNIRFSGVGSASPVNPESVKFSINSNRPVNAKSVDGRTNFSFTLSAIEKQRTMLLDAVYDRRPYQKYIRIPLPDSDFDVSFYPEGGNALTNCLGRIAVKAMQRDGTEIEVDGTVYDSRENEITRFKTGIRGMGQFVLTPVQGEKYHVVCTNGKGQTKRFDLPVAKNEGYALTAVWQRENLMVKVQSSKPVTTGDTLYLIVHTRGIVQDVRILENTGKIFSFPKESFPSGISNLLLLTKDMIPVSERLIFVDNGDYARVECKTDSDSYSVRNQVEYTISLTDESGEPLSGSFSVSVTDDYAVRVDTSSNILTSLLLSSDLRGNISDPAFYLQKTTQSAAALELLMLTQGWRRYDTERIVRNDYIYPDSLLEKGYEISGTVRRRQLLRAVPAEDANVNLLALSGDYFGNAVTDRNGRFYLHDGDMPDSTRFIIQTSQRMGTQDLELTIDGQTYPERVISAGISGMQDEDKFSNYADKAERQYVNEHGARMILLDEITITGQRRPVRQSLSYYNTPDVMLTEEEIDRRPPVSLSALLMRLPGVRVNNDTVYIARFQGARTEEGTSCPAVILIDGVPIRGMSIDWLEVTDVAQVDLLTSPINLVSLGIEGDCGAVAIYTREGKTNVRRNKPHIASIVPLGFQKPVEFYAPRYDSPEDFSKPDLRTTIHWQPNLVTDETGTAKFSFHTADSPSTYSVVIEGVAEDGTIIYKSEELRVKS